jgi:hypothetical protein
MSFEQPRNLSYLLHLWQVERNGELVWWASLENPRIGERQIFADLAELSVFLDEKTVNRCHPIVGNGLQRTEGTTASPAQPVKDAYSGYLSYLLRLLWADREENPAWRISLQSIQTTERLNFKDLAALTDYLEKRLSESKA